MEYKEALSKAQVTTPKQNYMVVRLSYSNNLVLPYKDGVKFLDAMTNAEQLYEPYSEQHRIAEVERGSITTNIMSHDEYVRFKVAALLGVSPDEVKNSEKAAT